MLFIYFIWYDNNDCSNKKSFYEFKIEIIKMRINHRRKEVRNMSGFEIINSSLYDDSLPMKLLEQAFTFQAEQAEKTTNKLVSDILKS